MIKLREEFIYLFKKQKKESKEILLTKLETFFSWTWKLVQKLSPPSPQSLPFPHAPLLEDA